MTIESAGKNLTELAFLGNNIADEQYRAVVASMAESVNKDVLHGMDDPARNLAARKLVEAASGKAYQNVQEVEDAITNATDLNASNLRDFICDGVLLAMRDGGDTKFSTALATGDPAQIEAVLPKELRPWARDVRNRFINDAGIRSVIDQVTMWELEDVDELKKAGKALDLLVGADPAQLVLAKEAVLTLFNQARAEKKGGNQQPNAQNQDVQLQYYAEQMELKEKLEVVSEVEWLEGLRTKSYDKAQIPALWMYTPPDWISGQGHEALKNWRDVYGIAEGMSFAVVRRREGGADGRFNTDVAEVKNGILKTGKVNEKNLKLLYESGYGFREALQRVVQDLYVKNNRGIFVFRPDTAGSDVDLFIKNNPAYKLQLAQDLVRTGAVGSEEQGVIMVSMACDLMELGGQVEMADSKRAVDYVSDALRAVMRPNQKFGAKIGGGELWGGPVGNWAMAVSGNEAADAKTLVQDTGITPDVLCGSVLNLMVNTAQGEMCLGDALMNEADINFKTVAKDFLHPFKKDFVMNACDVFLYITGKNKLEFKSIRESDGPINDWRGDLFNATRALREMGGKTNLDLMSTKELAGAIAGGAGLWPFEELFLKLSRTDEPNTDLDFMDGYLDVGDNIVRSVAQSPQEREELKKLFNINKAGVDRLYQMANDYSFVVNGVAPLVLRRFVQKRRGWKLI